MKLKFIGGYAKLEKYVSRTELPRQMARSKIWSEAISYQQRRISKLVGNDGNDEFPGIENDSQRRVGAGVYRNRKEASFRGISRSPVLRTIAKPVSRRRVIPETTIRATRRVLLGGADLIRSEIISFRK